MGQALEINNNNARLFFFNKFISVEFIVANIFIYFMYYKFIFFFLRDAKILELEKL